MNNKKRKLRKDERNELLFWINKNLVKDAFDYIKENNIVVDENFKIEAVKSNSEVLKYIKNPSVRVQSMALSGDYCSYKYIEKPNDLVTKIYNRIMDKRNQILKNAQGKLSEKDVDVIMYEEYITRNIFEEFENELNAHQLYTPDDDNEEDMLCIL